MKNTNYQTVPVYDYIKILDSEVHYVNNDVKDLKSNMKKHLLKSSKANANAKILELLLA